MLAYFNNLLGELNARHIVTKTLDATLYKTLVAQNLQGTADDYQKSFERFQLLNNKYTCLALYHIYKDYVALLNKPRRVNFLTGESCTENLESQKGLESQFWKLTDEFTDLDPLTCQNCGVQLQDGTCSVCFMGNKNFSSSYADMHRTNFNSKYSYFRKQHFYECMIQFQGKQPVVIEPEIIEKLKAIMKRKNTQHLTKLELLGWLKNLNCPKYYENVHLLYSILTGIPCPQFGELEAELLADFDLFLCEYNKLYQTNSTRKNFINVQYLLYQLLVRHRFKCRQDDFICPKTADTRRMYDKICGEIFGVLGWNHTLLV